MSHSTTHPATHLAQARPSLWAPSLRAVADRYDSWVVDQWGVLHNGVIAYPGAAEALRELMRRGDTVIVLSNSGKRSAPNVARLAKFGFGADCYTALITSGEVAREALSDREDPYYRGLGRRCWLVSNDGDTSVVDGLAIDLVATPGEADFVLLCGVGEAETVEHYDPQFRQAAARRLPMICANPDFVRLTTAGLKPACGTLAKRYEAIGGAVRWLGKPYPEMYRSCLRLIAANHRRATAVIGDSLDHDIAGGQASALDTIFLTDGIHHHEFAQAAHRDLLLRRMCERAGLAALPDIAMATLTW